MLLLAFFTGMLGSFHCLGMCGPIALSLPIYQRNTWTFLTNRMFYHLGRIITYSFLGLLVGLVGRGASLFISQQWLSVVIGILMLLFFLSPHLSQKLHFLSTFSFFTSKIKQQFIHFFKSKSFFATFLIGLLNGFLPCGLVYLALAGASVASSLQESGLYMVFFGLGTVPMMFGLTLAGRFVTPNFRKKALQFIPVFTILFAVWLIVRGLNLGVPYLSPKIESSKVECCHPHQ